MHPATLFLWKGWRFAGSARAGPRTASRALTFRRMPTDFMNIAVNVAIGARPFSPSSPALGTFSHVLALQCEKLGTFRLSVLSVYSLKEAFHPAYQRSSSNVAHGAQTPFRARSKLHNAPAHQRFQGFRVQPHARTARTKAPQSL